MGCVVTRGHSARDERWSATFGGIQQVSASVSSMQQVSASVSTRREVVSTVKHAVFSTTFKTAVSCDFYKLVMSLTAENGIHRFLPQLSTYCTLTVRPTSNPSRGTDVRTTYARIQDGRGPTAIPARDRLCQPLFFSQRSSKMSNPQRLVHICIPTTTTNHKKPATVVLEASQSPKKRTISS